MFRENKGIIISGILLILLSVGFTAVINFESFYEHNTSELIMYFVREIVRIGVSCGAFALAYKYGRSFVLKYGWIFVPLGIIFSSVVDSDGCMYIFGYDIEIVTLTNALSFLGLATYFYRYCLKSVIHTIIFWTASFVFLIVSERGYLTWVLFVMMGLMLIAARKNKLISIKSVWILNIVLYIMLMLRTANITLMGIVWLKDVFYDNGAMPYITRGIIDKIKWFGAEADLWLIGGDVKYYKLLCVFGLLGAGAGLALFAALTAFVYFVCKKCFKFVLTDTAPIACATVSIMLVRFILSMLANFGIVIYQLFAPIPVLSDGVCGYIAIFIMLGWLLGKQPSEHIETDLVFDDFYNGLIASVSDYIYEPTDCVPVCSLNQESKTKYLPDVEKIADLQFQSIKQYCDLYFGELIKKTPASPNELTEEFLCAENNLLNRLESLSHWDTNSFHIENKIKEEKIVFSDGTTAQWYPVYIRVANDLTISIFEEDKKHIYELWECVKNAI